MPPTFIACTGRISGADEADFPFVAKNKRQSELCVFCADLTGNTTERPSCRGNEVVGFGMAVAVFHDVVSIALRRAGEQVSDFTMSRGGLV